MAEIRKNWYILTCGDEEEFLLSEQTRNKWEILENIGDERYIKCNQTRNVTREDSEDWNKRYSGG